MGRALLALSRELSAERQALDVADRFRIRLAPHPERDPQSRQAGEQRDQERDLQGLRPRLRVYPDEIVLYRLRMPDQPLGQLGVAQELGVVLQGGRALLLLGR